jgi:hypothetical protein
LVAFVDIILYELIFVQLCFSSNVTLDLVTLTNFIKNSNFCGRLYFDSLVGKRLSDLYYNSSSNFQSNNWQKVQYDTDLLIWKWSYLYRNESLN